MTGPTNVEPAAAKGMIAFLLHYVELGYAVCPCVSQGKKPLSKHGFKDATNDPESVARYWRRWPNANVGLVPPAEVLVIDPDTADLVMEWQARYPELAGGPMVRTPGGGAHLYVRMPEAECVKCWLPLMLRSLNTRPVDPGS